MSGKPVEPITPRYVFAQLGKTVAALAVCFAIMLAIGASHGRFG
jgi:hypothetical protein